jgi:hypothetical protein
MAFAIWRTEAEAAMAPQPKRIITGDRSPDEALRAPPRTRRLTLRRSRPARCRTAGA